MVEHNVIIYSAEWCPWCHKAKEFLQKNKIKYEERDVEAKPEYAEEVQAKSKQTGIPVLDIDGKIIVGYDEAVIKRALGL